MSISFPTSLALFAIAVAAPVAAGPTQNPAGIACYADTAPPGTPPPTKRPNKPHHVVPAGSPGAGIGCTGPPPTLEAPNPLAGAPGATTPGPGSAWSNLSDWERWWLLWEDDYLREAYANAAKAPRTGSDDFYLGRGMHAGQAPAGITDKRVQEAVLPALLQALTDHSDPRVVRATLVALARGAYGTDSAQGVRLEIDARLRHSDETVAAAAALGLGILADAGSASKLSSLLADDETGRRLAGRTRVPDRVRAAAAYGLGELGRRTKRPMVRRSVARVLLATLELESTFAQPDVPLAATIALGSIPWGTERASGSSAARGSADDADGRSKTVQQLLRLFGDGPAASGAARDPRVRSQIPIAAARIVRRATAVRSRDFGTLRGSTIATLANAVGPRARRVPAEVQRGAVVALGIVADAGQGPANQLAMESLTEVLRTAPHPITRRMAMIALADLGSRSGSMREFALTQTVEETLRSRLLRGRGEERAWAAITIGTFASRLRAEGGTLQPDTVVALRAAFADARSVADTGAFALALGLVDDHGSVDALLARIDAGGGHQAVARCGLALGLMNAAPAAARLRDVASAASQQPLMLRGLAHGAILAGEHEVEGDLGQLLGKTRSVPIRGAVCAVLGVSGGALSVDTLLGQLDPKRNLTALARARASAALGRLCQRGPVASAPWDRALRLHAQHDRTTRLLGGPSAGSAGNPSGWQWLPLGGGAVAM